MTYGLTTLVQELRGRGDDLSIAAADKLERQADLLDRQWCPIETAPYDDTLCVVHWNDGSCSVEDLDHDSDPEWWKERGAVNWTPLIEPPKDR